MSAFFTTSFPTTNLGEQASTKRLLADAVISPVFYQPTAYLGTIASPVDITLVNGLQYIQGINRYCFYFFLTTPGGGTTTLVGASVVNCPLNILDTVTAGSVCNILSVPAGVNQAIQGIFDPHQPTGNDIQSNISLSTVFAGTYTFKIVISLTPESG